MNCPICFKIILEDSDGDFIYCDSCEYWIHAECEKISKSKMN